MVNRVKFVIHTLLLVIQHTQSTRLWSIFTLDVKVACVIHKLGQGGCHQDSGTKGTGNPIAWQHEAGTAQRQTEVVGIEKQDLLMPVSSRPSNISLQNVASFHPTSPVHHVPACFLLQACWL